MAYAGLQSYTTKENVAKLALGINKHGNIPFDRPDRCAASASLAELFCWFTASAELESIIEEPAGFNPA